jgi:hypothetical protein
MGQPLKAQILREMPRDKEITVTALLGDGDAIRLANKIYNFLKDNGYKLKENGIAQSVFNNPVNGLIVQPQGDGLQFIVGANPSN